MKCSKCNAELQPDAQVCPNCGAALSDKKRQRSGKVWKIVLAAAAGVLLALCLSVVIYWGVIGVTDFNDGMNRIAQLVLPRENDVYRKASYSVSDEKAQRTGDRVVATAGDNAELNNGLLQIFYWMDVYDYLENGSYDVIYYGLDYTQPLDEQSHRGYDGTWQQYFLENAIENWHSYQALALTAQEEGAELDEELQAELDALRDTLTQSVIDAGYTGVDALIQADMGPGCTYDDYYNYMKLYYTGYAYLNQKLSEYEVTDGDIEAYFAEHAQELAQEEITKDSGNLVDIRHILVAVQGGTEDEDGDVTYSQEEWDTCKAAAQELLDQWLAGEATEESFAQLAYEHSEDTGSNTNGGLYASLDADSGFVQEFIDWYMDESRKPGDYGLLQTSYGYHVMYFSGSEAEWIRTCREGLMAEKTEELLNEAMERFPLEVEYKKIALGVVDLSEV